MFISVLFIKVIFAASSTVKTPSEFPLTLSPLYNKTAYSFSSGIPFSSLVITLLSPASFPSLVLSEPVAELSPTLELSAAYTFFIVSNAVKLLRENTNTKLNNTTMYL